MSTVPVQRDVTLGTVVERIVKESESQTRRSPLQPGGTGTRRALGNPAAGGKASPSGRILRARSVRSHSAPHFTPHISPLLGGPELERSVDVVVARRINAVNLVAVRSPSV